MKATALVAALIATAVALPAIGQGTVTSGSTGAAYRPMDFSGEVVAPIGEITVRNEPPGTFFKSKGAQIGVAQPTESYRVLEERMVPTIAGRQNWLKVQRTNDPSFEGWIYNGTGSTAANVMVKK